MDLSDWIELTPEKFEARLDLHMADHIESDWVELYNALISQASEHGARISRIAVIAAEKFEAKTLNFEALLFWELVARTSCTIADLDMCLLGIRKMVAIDSDGNAQDTIVELAQDVIDCADNFGASLDQRPRVFAGITDVLNHYGLKEDVARLHLAAAAIYSRHGASQAAYRSIDDAERIAHEIASPKLLAEVYGIAVSTGVEENDHKWAAETGERALGILHFANEPPSASLLNNLAVAHMRLDQFGQAIGHFRAALDASTDPRLTTAVQINLAACLRSSGRLEEAWECVKEAEAGGQEDDDPERKLEFSLIAARIASERHSLPDLVKQLSAASRDFDEVMRDILRLHHRRGVRERYVPRIEGLLADMPPDGEAQAVLAPLAMVRANALGDWLAVHDWADALAEAPTVPKADKEAISALIIGLRKFGAPHLFGHREKYDDAWSPMNGGSLWDDLSSIARKLEFAGYPLPTAGMGLDQISGRLQGRLAEAHAIMAMTYSPMGPRLWCVFGDRYVAADIPLASWTEWRQAALAHASETITRTDFDKNIRDTLAALWASAEPLFELLACEEAKSIRFMQDFSDSLPLTALALHQPQLAERMIAGEFQVRIVSALHTAIEHPLVEPAIATLVDAGDKLLLSQSEAPSFAEAVAARSVHPLGNEFDTGNDAMLDADVILVSTHSSPLAFYRDAYFAVMGAPDGDHAISVEGLQIVAPDMRASLVILNACHSGSGNARNFQQSFRTADLVTFPALFTLNRKAVISAGAWKMGDTVSYLHSQLVASAIRQGRLPSEAVASSIARLPGLTRDEATGFLERIEDETIRSMSIARLANAPQEGLFSAPYVSGGLAIHGLL